MKVKVKIQEWILCFYISMCYIVFMIMIKYVLTLNDNKYYLLLKKREGILQMRLVFIFITVNLLKKINKNYI